MIPRAALPLWPPQYSIKTHKRARHVKLRASVGKGLEITVPSRFNINEIPDILEKHKAWIEKKLLALQAKREAALPQTIYLAATDEMWTVSYEASTLRPILSQRRQLKELIVKGDNNNKRLVQALLIHWVRKQAKQILPLLLADVSDKMQLRYERVTVRSQKTVWGSCTVAKAINLNYKLVMLPTYLAEHVMIHELSHTVHLNHSKRFWQLVAAHDSAWQQHRKALKKADQYIPLWLGE